jgi:hypothetical protein
MAAVRCDGGVPAVSFAARTSAAWAFFCHDVFRAAQFNGTNHCMVVCIACLGDRAMTATWTVKDNAGQILPGFAGQSRLEVGRKVVPTYFDAFRLHVSHSYREIFDRAVNQVLEREGWKIVRTKVRKSALLAANAVPS